MTNNKRLLATMAQHMNMSADSGMSRMTRSGLKYALMESGHGDAARKAGRNFEDMVDAFIALCDRAREAQLFARQRAHAARLAQIDAEMTWRPYAARTEAQ